MVFFIGLYKNRKKIVILKLTIDLYKFNALKTYSEFV